MRAVRVATAVVASYAIASCNGSDSVKRRDSSSAGVVAVAPTEPVVVSVRRFQEDPASGPGGKDRQTISVKISDIPLNALGFRECEGTEVWHNEEMRCELYVNAHRDARGVVPDPAGLYFSCRNCGEAGTTAAEFQTKINCHVNRGENNAFNADVAACGQENMEHFQIWCD